MPYKTTVIEYCQKKNWLKPDQSLQLLADISKQWLMMLNELIEINCSKKIVSSDDVRIRNNILSLPVIYFLYLQQSQSAHDFSTIVNLTDEQRENLEAYPVQELLHTGFLTISEVLKMSEWQRQYLEFLWLQCETLREIKKVAGEMPADLLHNDANSLVEGWVKQYILWINHFNKKLILAKLIAPFSAWDNIEKTEAEQIQKQYSVEQSTGSSTNLLAFFRQHKVVLDSTEQAIIKMNLFIISLNNNNETHATMHGILPFAIDFVREKTEKRTQKILGKRTEAQEMPGQNKLARIEGANHFFFSNKDEINNNNADYKPNTPQN